MNIKCINCFKDFHIKPSRAKRNPLYCSMQCRKDKAKVKCLNCSVQFTNARSNGVNRKYCSHSCYLKNYKIPLGELHHNWTTGITAYRRIAKHLKVSGCFLCKTLKTLEIHHKDGIRANNTIDNLICLCRKCHKLTHWGKTLLSKYLPFILSC